VALHLIADDLHDHGWYERLVAGTIAEVEAYAARWAAFEEHLAASAGDDGAGSADC
jgi:hypothetical protein